MHQKKLLITFKAISCDLIFWVFIDTLFLSLAKGLSPQQISLVFSVSLWISLGTKIPAYYLMKWLTPRQTVRLSTVLFLISAVIITFGNSLTLLIIGQSLYYLARDLHDVSDILLKNVCDRAPTGKNFVQCRSTSSFIYSSITLIAAVFLNRLINISIQLPMYICIAFRVVSCILALFLKDTAAELKDSDKGYLPGKSHWYFSRATVWFLIASVLFQTFMIHGNSNLRLILQTDLSEFLSENKVVRIVSLCIIGTRIVKLLGALLVSLLKKEHTDYEKLAAILSVLLLFVPLLGFLGCRGDGISSSIFIGAGLLLLYFLCDPFNDIQAYLLSRKLNNDQMTALLAVKNTVIRLVCALFSTVITMLISKTAFQWVMVPFGLLAAAILIATVAGSYYYHRRQKDYKVLWGDQFLETDSLFGSAAVLMLHYDAAKPEKVSPRQIAAKVRDIREIGSAYRRFSFSKFAEYDYDQLYQCYLTGNPVAVHACRDEHWAWYPILYMDRDDAVVFDPKAEKVFLKDFEKTGEICIFEIKQPTGTVLVD